MPDIKLLTDQDARIVDGKFQYNDGKNWVDIQKDQKIYGIRFLLNSSDPASFEYFGEAAGMTAGSDDWDSTDLFQNIRPCIIRTGGGAEIKKYLDPNDFTKFEDGSNALEYLSGGMDSGSGLDDLKIYNTYIEIPKIGVKITRDDLFMYVQLTTAPDVPGFSYKAHTTHIEGDCDNLYVGAFLASTYTEDGSAPVILSQSGRVPKTNVTYDELPPYATLYNNFAGVDLENRYYHVLNFYTLTLLQCLYLLRYGNRDSQVALGMGYVGDSDWVIMAKPTGATVDKGMYYGSSNPMEQMKFMGIEDFWGNLYQWIYGLSSSADYHALTAYTVPQFEGVSSWNDLGQIMTSYVGGYMSDPQGTNDLGFIPKSCSGSSTTYFADYADFGAECVPVFGGSFVDGSYAGAFLLYVNFYPGVASDYLSGRLMLVASTDIEEVDSFETE